MHPVPRWWSPLASVGVAAALAGLLLLPPGENHDASHGTLDAETGLHVPDESKPAPVTVGRVLGQASTMALALSLLLAYPQVSGRVLAHRVRRRGHAWLGAALLAAAVVHGVMLPVAGVWRGWHAGVLAAVLLGSHGASGAWRGRLVVAWGAARWRWAHVATGWAALAASLWHALVYGQHLGLLRGVLLE